MSFHILKIYARIWACQAIQATRVLDKFSLSELISGFDLLIFRVDRLIWTHLQPKLGGMTWGQNSTICWHSGSSQFAALQFLFTWAESSHYPLEQKIRMLTLTFTGAPTITMLMIENLLESRIWNWICRLAKSLFLHVKLYVTSNHVTITK